MNVLERFKNDEVVVLNTPYAKEVLEKLGLRERAAQSNYLVASCKRDKFTGISFFGLRELVDISEFEKLLNKDLPQPSKDLLQKYDAEGRVLKVTFKNGYECYHISGNLLDAWYKPIHHQEVNLIAFDDKLLNVSKFEIAQAYGDIIKVKEKINGEYQLIAERKKPRIPTDADRGKMVRVRDCNRSEWSQPVELIAVVDKSSDCKYVTFGHSSGMPIVWRYAELID